MFNIFGKTHESITAGLTKMINDLDKLANEHAESTIAKRAEITKLELDIKALNSEHNKCLSTASKLKEIVS